MKQVDRFQRLLLKLEPVEFLGVLKILGVKILEGEEPRLFEELYPEAILKFSKLSRPQRKNLMGLVKAATKQEIIFKEANTSRAAGHQNTEKGDLNGD